MITIALQSLRNTSPTTPTKEDIEFLSTGKCNQLDKSQSTYCSVLLKEEYNLFFESDLVRERCVGITSEGIEKEENKKLMLL